jgi:hypothetical protein
MSTFKRKICIGYSSRNSVSSEPANVLTMKEGSLFLGHPAQEEISKDTHYLRASLAKLFRTGRKLSLPTNPVGHRNILNRTITSAGLQSLTYANMFIITAVLRVKYNCLDVSSVIVPEIIWSLFTLLSYGT